MSTAYNQCIDKLFKGHGNFYPTEQLIYNAIEMLDVNVSQYRIPQNCNRCLHRSSLSNKLIPMPVVFSNFPINADESNL